MGWACGAYGWGEGVYRVLVGKPEGRRPLGRPRRRWADNIRMDLQEVGCGYMDWIGLAQDRDSWRTLVSAVMNLRVPWNAGSFLTSCGPVSFSTLDEEYKSCVTLNLKIPHTFSNKPFTSPDGAPCYLNSSDYQQNIRMRAPENPNPHQVLHTIHHNAVLCALQSRICGPKIPIEPVPVATRSKA